MEASSSKNGSDKENAGSTPASGDRPQPPASKRRKLDANGKAKQDSFADVLERLQASGGPGGQSPVETTQNWARPALPRIDPKKDKIIFQQIDIEEYFEPGAGPTLRVFGITQAGNSVLLHVNDFKPYLYVSAPRGFENADCRAFTEQCNNAIGQGGRAVVSTTVTHKRSLWGYKGDEKTPFLKVTLSDQKFVPKLRGIFDRGEFSFREMFNGPLLSYESNIAYALRFMIDKKVTGMNWLQLEAGKYIVRPSGKKVSKCQLEMDCSADDLISHAPEGEWSAVAPLRILSFDIECAGRKGIFPEAQIDPVIQIANMVTRQGESTPFIRNVFTLNSCAHIVGSQVLSYDKEEKLLQEWSDFVEKVDPDMIIGYNTTNFDFPYLLDRAKALKVARFPYLSRLLNYKTEAKDAHFSSKAYGTRDSKTINLDGRLQLDILTVMQRDYKLRSYTLNAVCAHFLGEQKEEVHYSIITELQNGTDESRRRLAVYCLKDAYLPQRLMDKLMCFVNYTEMARVTGVPFNYLLARGQQIKVVSQLYRKANEDGYVIPAFKTEGSEDVQYEGATVIEPERGYYDVPIATLDFASLYPSIMMAHNLCYTTLVDKATIDNQKLVLNEDYIQTPNNDFFVTPQKRKGLLAIVLEDLLSARKKAKGELKTEKDPFRRAVLDGRQLALKVSANSVYGFTGATIGKLPCLAISSSVTAYGRDMIEFTKTEVEKEYRMDNGYDFDARVIYGDTDSVMVKFGCPDLETSMRLGAEAADLVSAKFVKPIKLEFEKVYFPYLLINKKRYAGLYWTKPDKYDKMDTKGIETVRRDNCRLVQSVIETCLHKMLIDRDVKGAQEYTKQVISDLLQNKVDMSQLVITKALAKAEYEGKQPHVELAAKMRKRDPGSAPSLGDRVAYVIIRGTKGAAASDRAEDPIYCLENNIPVDTKYYLENQLSKPLIRIFEPILGSKAQSLLAGDHTRTISIATPTTGGLMGFIVKTTLCLGCKTPLKSNKNDGAVCQSCRPRLPELYQRQLVQTSARQINFARLWTQCQRCQGSLHQDVLCSSKDCPIFYQRKRAQKDVGDAMTVMDRIERSW